MGRILSIANPIHFFKPQPKPVSTVEWLCRRVYLIFYVAWDAVGRVRKITDGMDKSNKLAIALLQAGELAYVGEKCHRMRAVGSYLKGVNDFFGGLSVFGRITDMTSVNKHRRLAYADRSPLKRASIAFLGVSKAAEFARWFDSVHLLPVKWMGEVDATYLGGVASRIGQTSLLRGLELNTLTGTKNAFLILNASYGILDHFTTLVDANKWDAKLLAKVFLSVAYDMGKIGLTLWLRFWSYGWLFVGAALATSCVGLSKILLDSYDRQPLHIPSWVRA